MSIGRKTTELITHLRTVYYCPKGSHALERRVTLACIVGAVAAAVWTALFPVVAYRFSSLPGDVRSLTVDAGYPKHWEWKWYFIAFVIFSIAAAIVFVLTARRLPPGQVDLRRIAEKPVERWPWWTCTLLVPVVIMIIAWNAEFFSGFWTEHTLMVEEGKHFAWLSDLAAGKRLYADEPYLFGPLLAGLQYVWCKIFGLTITSLRAFTWSLHPVLFLTVFALFKMSAKRWWIVILGTLLLIVLYYPVYPVHSVVYLRVGVALVSVAVFAAALKSGNRFLHAITGAALACALLFSLETGAAAAAAIVATALVLILFQPPRRKRAIGLVFLAVGFLAALGGMAVASGEPVRIVRGLARTVSAYGDGLFAVRFPGLFEAASARELAVTLVWYGALLLGFVMAAASFLHVAFGKEGRRQATVFCLAAFALFSGRGFFGRSDLSHFQGYAVVFVMLAVLAAESSIEARRGRPASNRVIRIVVFILLVLGVVAFARFVCPHQVCGFLRQDKAKGLAAPRADMGKITAPRAGGLAVRADFAAALNQAVDEVQKRVPEGEEILVFPNSPVLIFLAERPSAGLVTMDALTTISEGKQWLARLAAKPPALIVEDAEGVLADLFEPDDRAPGFTLFLERRYERTLTLGRFRFWTLRTTGEKR